MSETKSSGALLAMNDWVGGAENVLCIGLRFKIEKRRVWTLRRFGGSTDSGWHGPPPSRRAC